MLKLRSLLYNHAIWLLIAIYDECLCPFKASAEEPV